MHQTCRPNVSREWTELNSGKHSKWKACWQSLHWIHCHLATRLFLPSWNQAIRINSNWLPKEIFCNVWYVLSLWFVPMLKSYVWNTCTFPTWSSLTNRNAGPSGSHQRAWRWTIGWWRSCTPRHRPVGAEAVNSSVSNAARRLWQSWKLMCFLWKFPALKHFDHLATWMRLRSAKKFPGAPWCSLDKTDQCTSISVSAPWFQWVNIPKDEMLMKLTSQAAALKAEKNWPVPIFQIKAK